MLKHQRLQWEQELRDAEASEAAIHLNQLLTKHVEQFARSPKKKKKRNPVLRRLKDRNSQVSLPIKNQIIL